MLPGVAEKLAWEVGRTPGAHSRYGSITGRGRWIFRCFLNTREKWRSETARLLEVSSAISSSPLCSSPSEEQLSRRDQSIRRGGGISERVSGHQHGVSTSAKRFSLLSC